MDKVGPGPLARKAILKVPNLTKWTNIIMRNQYESNEYRNNFKTFYDTNHVIAARSHVPVLFTGKSNQSKSTVQYPIYRSSDTQTNTHGITSLYI